MTDKIQASVKTNAETTDNIKASVKSESNPVNIRTSTIVAQPASRISNIADVDLTDLNLGSVLVYNENTEKWKATKELNQQDLDGGEF